MKIKNNSKNLTSIKQKNINYSINEFFSLDMFNPITQKNYFEKYDLSIFKKKKFRTHVFGMGGSSLSTKLLAQFLDPYSLSKNLFIYDNPSPVIIKNVLLDLFRNRVTQLKQSIFLV
jgi:glucose-6-phosphate isomerase